MPAQEFSDDRYRSAESIWSGDPNPQLVAHVGGLKVSRLSLSRAGVPLRDTAESHERVRPFRFHRCLSPGLQVDRLGDLVGGVPRIGDQHVARCVTDRQWRL